MLRVRKYAQAVPKENALLKSIYEIIAFRLRDDEIQLTSDNAKQKFYLNFLHHARRYGGIAFPPSSQGKRDNAARKTGQRAEGHDASTIMLNSLNLCFGEIYLFSDQPGVRVENLPEACRSDARRPSIQQLDP
jgi:hypothetical protein